MDRKVLVIILNYNSAGDAIACVESVLKSDHRNFTIALIDNLSPDNSIAAFKQYFEQKAIPFSFLRSSNVDEMEFQPGHIFLLANHENRGFAAGNNLVLGRILDWDCLVWLLNPDILVEPATMRFLVQDLGDDLFRVMGNRVFSMEKPHRLLHLGGGSIDWKSATVRPSTHPSELIDYVYGGSLFTHSSLFREFGLLPEQYFLYWEETDWCYTLKKAGIPLVYSPNAIVYDKVGGSIGRGSFAFYYYSLNGLRFVNRFQPNRKFQVLFFNCLRVAKRVLSFQFQIASGIFWGTVDFLRGKFNSNGVR